MVLDLLIRVYLSVGVNHRFGLHVSCKVIFCISSRAQIANLRLLMLQFRALILHLEQLHLKWLNIFEVGHILQILSSLTRRIYVSSTCSLVISDQHFLTGFNLHKVSIDRSWGECWSSFSCLQLNLWHLLLRLLAIQASVDTFSECQQRLVVLNQLIELAWWFLKFRIRVGMFKIFIKFIQTKAPSWVTIRSLCIFSIVRSDLSRTMITHKLLWVSIRSPWVIWLGLFLSKSVLLLLS